MTTHQLTESRPTTDDIAARLAAAALATARCFSAGATMWVCAPGRPGHAQHVAVEFVHPVVTGTRALPAFALDGPDPAAEARALSQAGDLLVLVAEADDGTALDLLRRAPAWGLATLWIGSGPRPPASSADHLLWLDGDDRAAAAGGGYVRLYHLLWELTHVCFEHPGLLDEPPPPAGGPSCITCADEGRIAEVFVAPAGPEGRAVVRAGIGRESVDVTAVGDVVAGDLLIVHAGVAIARLPASDAPARGGAAT